MRTLILGVATGALCACSTALPQLDSTPTRVALATFPGGTIITSSLTGRFVRESGCLLFRDRSGRAFFPILKAGSSLTGDTVSIAGAVDKRVVRIEERVVIEGDAQDWSNVPESYRLSAYKGLCSVPPFFVINAK